MLFKPSTAIIAFLGFLLVTIHSNDNTVQAFSPGLSPSISKTTAAPLPLATMKQSSIVSSSSSSMLRAVKNGQQDGGAKKKMKKNKPIIEGPTFVGLVAAFAIFDYVYLHVIFNRL